jgi:hypothetical protein
MRLPSSVDERIIVERNRLTAEGLDGTRVEIKVTGSYLYVSPRLAERLPCLPCLAFSEGIVTVTGAGGREPRGGRMVG